MQGVPNNWEGQIDHFESQNGKFANSVMWTPYMQSFQMPTKTYIPRYCRHFHMDLKEEEKNDNNCLCISC